MNRKENLNNYRWPLNALNVLKELSIEEIESLLPKGIRQPGLLLDADATLFPHDCYVPYKGVQQLIRVLGESGIKIAIVSNNPNRDLAFQRSSSLEVPLEFIVTPGYILDRKPAPAMLNRALGKLALEPEEVASIGDGVTDVIAACLARIGVDNIGIILNPPEEAKGYPLRSKIRELLYFAGGVDMSRFTQAGP